MLWQAEFAANAVANSGRRRQQERGQKQENKSAPAAHAAATAAAAAGLAAGRAQLRRQAPRTHRFAISRAERRRRMLALESSRGSRDSQAATNGTKKRGRRLAASSEVRPAAKAASRA